MFHTWDPFLPAETVVPNLSRLVTRFRTLRGPLRTPSWLAGVLSPTKMLCLTWTLCLGHLTSETLLEEYVPKMKLFRRAKSQCRKRSLLCEEEKTGSRARPELGTHFCRRHRVFQVLGLRVASPVLLDKSFFGDKQSCTHYFGAEVSELWPSTAFAIKGTVCLLRDVELRHEFS